MSTPGATDSPLAWLASQPVVASAVDTARDACTTLRWHNALRRRHDECACEARIWAAHASARLEGVIVPLATVRDVSRGAAAAPGVEGATLMAALRATELAGQLALRAGAAWRTTSRGALARLHVAAGAGVVEDGALGRPDRDLGRIDALCALLATSRGVPAPVVAALLQAEVSTMGAFGPVGGIVGRAAARSVVVGFGVDPMGVAVYERAQADSADELRERLAGYATGTPADVTDWVVFWCDTLRRGAQIGALVCDSVARGRLEQGVA